MSVVDSPRRAARSLKQFTADIDAGELQKSQGRIANAPWAIIVLCVTIICGAAIQLWTIAIRRYPGDADAGYYFDVASNFLSGKGFVANTIWFFGFHSDSVTHYGGAYWKPMGPLIAALSMKAFGATATGALFANYVLLLAVSACAVFCLRGLARGGELGSPGEASFAYGLTFSLALLNPWLFQNTIDVVPTMAFAFLGFAALYLVSLAELRLMPIAGALAGGAALARNDGVLLLPVVAVFLLVIRLDWKTRLACMGFFCLGILPVLVGERVYGAVMGLPSSNPLLLLFMTSFDDLYLLPQDLTFGHLVSSSKALFVLDRIKSLGLNVRRIFEHFGTFPTLLAAYGIVRLAPADARARRFVAIWLCFLGVELFVNSVVLPYTGMEGSFRTSFVVAFPAGIALAVLGLGGLSRNSSARTFLGCTLLLSIAIPGLIETSRATRAIDPPKMLTDQRLGAAIKRMAEIDGISQQNIVVLGRINSGNFAVLSGLKHVYIPSGGPGPVNTIIDRYHPQYLVLDGTEPGFGDIYLGSAREHAFQYVGPVDGTAHRLFRILGHMS
jgi:hypothetical protein